MSEDHFPKTDGTPGKRGPYACDPATGCCGWSDRRGFLKRTGLAAAALAASGPGGLDAIAGPSSEADTRDHFVPSDKKLKPEWVRSLLAKGQATWYTGNDLKTIAMPVGGIGAGQLYLTGDGRLVHWDLFNRHNFTGYGRTNYEAGRQPESPLQQGFAIRAVAGNRAHQRTLDAEGFPRVRFCGEYPIGTVEYVDASFPVHVRLQAFSPFIPLNEDDSALPATLLEFTLENAHDAPVDVMLAGWLENAVAIDSSQGCYGLRRNRAIREDGLTMVQGEAEAAEPPREARAPIVLADFEGGDYGLWTTEGEAFGPRPAAGTLDGQQEVSGFLGKGLVNTYRGGSDRMHGTLTSPAFDIERSFISFLVGGGKHEATTCVNLLIDGRVVRTATGRNNERLRWHHWDVRDLAGKRARIEIVDAESGGWGHINVDQIELRDQPRSALSGSIESQPDFGTMGIGVLAGGPDALSSTSLPAGPPADALFGDDRLQETGTGEKPFGQMLCGAVGQRVRLDPGARSRVTFVVAWCFPNRVERDAARGNYYANRFGSAADVARYVADNRERLAGETHRWHDTWYDSTLPHWLLDRLFSTTSTLATSTCQWWANGRFWAWEGVGCCHGTCAHVWNYEHAMARLFPRLERSVRQMQDFEPQAGFDEQTGMVRFRGEGWRAWAGDGQAGTVLKAYREHQMSADDAFLVRNWARIRKSLEFLIGQDADDNGLLEGAQHNTYDINFFGPNTMVGSLYLAALRAGEAMADEMGDSKFAARCRRLFQAGSEASVQRLFDGEYFIQEVDPEKHPKYQYGQGCLADQLFGQGWAHQVGLGYVYPKETVKAALRAIWKYNWAPDVGPQNAAHRPERWFARPGEAGLFTCTWPKSPYLDEGVRYKNEVWTGIEYQVAGNMAWDGLLTEALAICRAVHERYHPSKRNPWNEVECGDHYARGMASYGVLLGLCGFEYHGPKRHFGYAPRIAPHDFRAAFTAAEGWGTLVQQREGDRQVNRIALRWGRLSVKTLALQIPDNQPPVSIAVSVDGRPVGAQTKHEHEHGQVLITVDDTVELKAEEEMVVEIRMS